MNPGHVLHKDLADKAFQSAVNAYLLIDAILVFDKSLQSFCNSNRSPDLTQSLVLVENSIYYNLFGYFSGRAVIFKYISRVYKLLKRNSLLVNTWRETEELSAANFYQESIFCEFSFDLN